MTEDQTTSDQASVDPQRKAEIDDLAAQLASAAAGEAPAKAPVRRRTSRRVTAPDPAEFTPSEPVEAPAATEPAEPAEPETAEAAEAAAPAKATRAPRRRAPAKTAKADADGTDAAAETPADSAAAAESTEAAETTQGTESTDAAEPGEATEAADSAESGETAESGEHDGAEGDDSTDGAEGEPRTGRSRRGRSRSRNGGDSASGSATQPSQANRRGRGRGSVGEDGEPEILDDDVLIPVAGILDVLDNYAFVRTTGYLPGPTDVYVSLGQVKRYGLRRGDAVVGAIRQPREGEQTGRQKYNALVKVDSVNGQTAEQSLARTEFASLKPLRPTVSLGLAAPVADLGKGARGLVVGERGKTALVSAIAERVSEQHPDSHLMVVLVNPRPEEVSDFRDGTKGEVVVAALEQSAEDHVTVIDLAVERAKRLVELGIDVVVLIDSLTGLGRAHAAQANRPSLEDPSLALPVRRLFAAARAVEDSASLTIIGTASEATALDRLVATELRSTANALVQLP